MWPESWFEAFTAPPGPRMESIEYQVSSIVNPPMSPFHCLPEWSRYSRGGVRSNSTTGPQHHKPRNRLPPQNPNPPRIRPRRSQRMARNRRGRVLGSKAGGDLHYFWSR